MRGRRFGYQASLAAVESGSSEPDEMSGSQPSPSRTTSGPIGSDPVKLRRSQISNMSSCLFAYVYKTDLGVPHSKDGVLSSPFSPISFCLTPPLPFFCLPALLSLSLMFESRHSGPA